MLVGVRGARDVLHSEPEVAYATLGRVEESAEHSLAELRRSLGLLRDPDTSATRTPQPSLKDLEALFADAGLPVRLHASGKLRDLPDGLKLSVYRLVQEALTNVRKHANAHTPTFTSTSAMTRSASPCSTTARAIRVAKARASSGCASGWRCSAASSNTARVADGGYRVAATLPIP